MKSPTLLATLVMAMSQLMGASAGKTSFNANFDDLAAVPEEAAVNPIGVYEGISYSNLNVGDPVVNADGVSPQSKPNFAVGSSSPASMTVSFSGSEYKTLALDSLYYGCRLNVASQGAVTLPESCTITVTGFKSGKAMEIQTFTYSPPKGAVLASLAQGKFKSSFKGVDTVTYAQSPSTTTQLVLDTIQGVLST